MAQQTTLQGMDTFNRVFGCRNTFSTETVREGLVLAPIDPMVLEMLDADTERAAKESKKRRTIDGLWRGHSLPLSPWWPNVLEPLDFDPVAAQSLAACDRLRASAGACHCGRVFSLTSADGYERLVGSEMFQAVMGERPVPARSQSAST